MKKIFYILASAIVALGAVACENDVMDNIATVEGDTVSFVAAIDDTKTDLTADNKTIWDEDDTISITWTDAKGERTDVFSNKETGDQNKFTCTADGLAAITEAEVVATYSHNGDGKIDSEAGKAGSLLAYSGAFTELKFQVQNAFLKFTAAEGDVVTLTASEEIFSTTDGTTFNIVATGEAQYVAIEPKTTTITYAINDVVCTTSKENALAVGKIYNLGTLNAPAATVNGVAYETLAAALEAAAEGATIELLADAGDVTISQACTINAGTYTINITAGEGYAVIDNGDKTFTVAKIAATIKGSFDGWGSGINMFAEGDYYVAKNVNFTSDVSLKFVTTAWVGGPTNADIDVLCKAALGGGNNIGVAKGTYDIYLKNDSSEFYIVTTGKTYTGGGSWRLFGDKAITGINTNWSQSSYLPMWKGVDGQYYITISFTGKPYFKLYKGNGQGTENVRSGNGGDQEVTTTGQTMYWGDSGKAFYINATSGTKTVGFNGNYIWLQ